jgi:GNAT superfamily N-acetyltransferase
MLLPRQVLGTVHRANNGTHQPEVKMSDSVDEELVITQVTDSYDAEQYLPSLTTLLQHCVNDDPSTSSLAFLAPLSKDKAEEYWKEVFTGVTGPKPMVVLLVAAPEDDPFNVLATIQIARMHKETHNYKGEIGKLLVHPDHRRYGLGKRLVEEAERFARDDLGLEMLLLDTATDTPARHFYARLGWTEWGLCPDYARFADGRKGDCTFFYKRLQ